MRSEYIRTAELALSRLTTSLKSKPDDIILMPLGKKKTALLIALLLVIVSAASILYGISVSDFDEKRTAISPSEIRGGEVVDFVLDVQSSGTVTVNFPWGMLAYDDGGFTAERNVTFQGSSLEFSALLSPWLNTTQLFVEGDGWNQTIEITVLEPENPLTSGESYYDFLYTLTQDHPIRQTGTRGHYAAADWMYSEFQKMGLESEIYHYRWSDRAVGIGPDFGEYSGC